MFLRNWKEAKKGCTMTVTPGKLQLWGAKTLLIQATGTDLFQSPEDCLKAGDR
jgi:hypothetical protein